MPFNIDTFRNQIANRGYLTNNKFEVVLTPPKIMFGGIFSSLANFGNAVSALNVMSQIKYRVDQVRVPGISLMSTDERRYSVGTTQKMPYSSQFNEISISMSSDGYGDIWQFWYNWIRGIHEFTGTTSSLIGVGTSLPSYTVEYKDNYSTTMEFIVYDLYGSPVVKIDLFEAFPVALREIPLSCGDQNNLMHLNISIAYTDFTIVGANFASPYTITNAFDSLGSIVNESAYLNNTLTNTFNNLINSGTVSAYQVPPSPSQNSINTGGVTVERVNI